MLKLRGMHDYIHAISKAFGTDGISERIHLVKNEVTLIHGARDAIIPHSYLQKWAEIFPNLSGTHLVDAAGHQVEFDEPEKVASIVTSVLG